jgi:ATP-binding protein involved in chromosome partitioning
VTAAAARFIVAVGSGKGGVGKSTVALQLAFALRRRGLAVGLLDADLYGPDIPLMLNLKREVPAQRWDFWRGGDVRFEPLEQDGLQLMSVGFLLGERQALTLAAPLLGAALRQLVDRVEWRSLDVLLIDLPPGTADLQQQLLAEVGLAGALVVVGPQDVAHLDARKFIDFLRAANVRVLGGIENMRGLSCPHCGELIELFPVVADTRSIWSDGVPQLGSVALAPALASEPGTPAQQQAFDGIAAELVERLEHPAAA